MKLRNISLREAGQRLAKGESLEGCQVRALMPVECRAIDQEARTVDFRISNAALDRDGDTIRVSGWNLKAYRKNPVVLWAHDSRQPPVAKARNTRKDGDQLTSTAEFTSQELYPFGHMVFRMYVEGFLHAVSVGFMPEAWERSEEEDRPYGIDFTKQELLEYSTVPVPSNPEALTLARSAGIDTAPLIGWAEQVLDGGGKLFIPRSMVEAAHRAATGRGATVVLSTEQQAELAARNIAAQRAQEAAQLPTGVPPAQLAEVHAGPGSIVTTDSAVPQQRGGQDDEQEGGGEDDDEQRPGDHDDDDKAAAQQAIEQAGATLAEQVGAEIQRQLAEVVGAVEAGAEAAAELAQQVEAEAPEPQQAQAPEPESAEQVEPVLQLAQQVAQLTLMVEAMAERLAGRPAAAPGLPSPEPAAPSADLTERAPAGHIRVARSQGAAAPRKVVPPQLVAQVPNMVRAAVEQAVNRLRGRLD